MLQRKKQFLIKNENIFFVEGYIRGIIYDYSRNIQYWLGPLEQDMFINCQVPVNELALIQKVQKLYPEVSEAKIKGYIKNFKKRKLLLKTKDASISVKPVEIPYIEAPKLRTFWCELTLKCNLKCLHCYACANKSSVKNLNEDFWKSVIDQAAGLNIHCLQFIGGEPLLHEHFWSLLDYAIHKNKFDYVEIFTNGTLIKQKDFSYLKENQVHIATSLYSVRADVHDQITQVPGSFEKTWEFIDNLKKYKIPFRVACIVLSLNEPYMKEFRKKMKKLKIESYKGDPVRLIGRAMENKHLQPKYIEKINNIPPMPHWEDFCINHEWNSCWGRTICVRYDGILIPCVFARDIELGSMKIEKLQEILSKEKTLHYRKISKDMIQECKECEFRYACLDCRPLVELNDILKKYPRCCYEPLKGNFEGK